ncbi:SDR family oxidoreductase [Novosphingobium sp. MMS21-SN21R]|uniref:SDR family NAD(P)-dependent oxidoreductase n=1 Tax=Novosphingobium sp. MMS21-SN21R TaxID=2969298 RepID=UPI0028861A74|nr:SDR family oxidoreductase [Novosphingobium sp. MMS21-SN21R]MDT0510244.1 SDR family oxidoreductase [Novosphingobium sp. MMS21-SN21R]
MAMVAETLEQGVRANGAGEYSLNGRVAVIAGGSGGIGAATARRFAAGGASVVIGYNGNAAKAQELVDSLPNPGAHMAVHLPMEDGAQIDAAARAVADRYGTAHILVNSAGVTKAVPHAQLDDLDDATFDRILATNVRGPFATIRSFAPLLRSGGDSVIINVSSISAATGLGSSIAYCASKAALDTMGKSLARVLGPEIRVISVSPAAVATDFVPGRGREGVERQAASTPLQRVCEPGDVALAIISAVTHLRLTTGSVIEVDGGRHL